MSHYKTYFKDTIFKNKLQEETAKLTDPYTWIEPIDPRNRMTDRKINESRVDMNQFCLSKEEQEEVCYILIKYMEMVNLRDKIGTCSKIEVDLQDIAKSLFFIRPFHVKEEDKQMLIKK